MRKILMTFVLVFSFFCAVKAQDVDVEEEESHVNLGLGLGIDYGGIGGRLTVLPAKQVGLFLGLGYNLMGAGYNVGVNIKFSHGKKVTPYLIAMYGYNAVIKIDGLSSSDKTYYGPSAGMGFAFRSRHNHKNYFNLELLIPFRSQEYQDDLNAIKSNPYIKLSSEPLPIAISLGYHFGL